MKSRLLPYLALVGATLFWAGNYIVGAAAIHQMSTFSLVYLRWAVALIPLLIAAQLIERPNWGAALKKWPLLLILGILGLAGYNFLLYISLNFTSALNASLINALNPALLVVAAIFLLKDRITLVGAIGLVLSFIGAIVLLTKGDIGFLLTHPLNRGDLLMLGAIVSWTAYTLIGRKYAIGIPPITGTAIQVGSVLIVLTALIPFNKLAWPQTPSGTWSLLFIAVFPSILSYVLWNSALQKLKPSQAGIFMNLLPVFTAIASVMLGQQVAWMQIVGGILVIGGVLLTNIKPKARDALS